MKLHYTLLVTHIEQAYLVTWKYKAVLGCVTKVMSTRRWIAHARYNIEVDNKSVELCTDDAEHV